ncbi:MAG: DUF1614 domain-containing protein [Calditrichaeota bacterium]|nr:MAG: DUF1614 domain-containing protein [Calditrichota bacterium]
MFFGPLSILFILFFFVGLVFLFVFIQIGVITYVFDKIGIAPEYIFSLLLITLLGSYINIPVYKIESELEPPGEIVNFFGWRFIIPRPWRPSYTIVAVNLGGALIPTLLSTYLILNHLSLFPQILIAVLIVTFIAKKISRPIRGLGIASPPLIAPVAAALIALILAPGHSPVVAYCAGTLGVLIGADLLNADKFDKLGAPVVSIGGAGTFDGIFFTGVFAVLLASF